MVIDRGCRQPARTRLPRPSATAPSARPAPGASTAGPAAAGRRDGQVQPRPRPVHRRLRHPRRGRAGWRGWFAQGLPGEGLGFCATVRSVQVGGRRGDNEHDFGVTPVADDPLFALPGPPAHPCYETSAATAACTPSAGRSASARPATLDAVTSGNTQPALYGHRREGCLAAALFGESMTSLVTPWGDALGEWSGQR